MTLLVAGCGSIGQRHIRNLIAIGAGPVLAFDPSEAARQAAASAGATPLASLAEGLSRRPDAAIIATPPDLHVAQAIESLDAGAHVFIEKPIAASLEGVDALIARADEAGRVAYVGYNLRFHAAIREIKNRLDAGAIGRLIAIRAEFGQYLPDWRPSRDYRQVYTAQASRGGGVLLDVSHEIDYVRWLAGEVSTVQAIADNSGTLEIDVEDLALMTLRFESGAVGHIHLDCLQRVYSRTCKLIGTSGTLLWDFSEGIRLYQADTRQWTHLPIVPDTNEMYVDQMKHFVDCIRGAATPAVTARDGRRVLEIALAARRAAAARCEVAA